MNAFDFAGLLARCDLPASRPWLAVAEGLSALASVALDDYDGDLADDFARRVAAWTICADQALRVRPPVGGFDFGDVSNLRALIVRAVVEDRARAARAA
jgi:hypothetical protein